MKFHCDEEVWSIVERFERCELELAEFDHAKHLAVGMAYLSTEGFDQALTRMRASLVRFSGHHEKQGYHETISRFWLMQLAEMTEMEVNTGSPLWERVNHAIEELANKDLIFQCYERGVLMSEAARAEWVAPSRTRPSRTRKFLVRGSGYGR